MQFVCFSIVFYISFQRAQEEMNEIEKHMKTSKEKESAKPLDKPEQFLFELSQIPNFSARVFCILLQSTFTESIATIQRKLEILQKTLDSSKTVMQVLGLVLAFGNFMNGGNRTRGQVDGFALDILPKLKDVKSSGSQVTFHYLGLEGANCHRSSSNMRIVEEKLTFPGSNFSPFDASHTTLACTIETEKVCCLSSEDHLQPFKDKMEEFLSQGARTRVSANFLHMVSESVGAPTTLEMESIEELIERINRNTAAQREQTAQFERWAIEMGLAPPKTQEREPTELERLIQAWEQASAAPQSPEPRGEEPPLPEPRGEEPPLPEPRGEEPPLPEPRGEEPPLPEPRGEEPPLPEPRGEEPPLPEPRGEEPPLPEPRGEEPPLPEPRGEEPPLPEPRGEEPPLPEPRGEEPPLPGHPPKQLASPSSGT
ncbi:UNVERIFIED_CONTAM: hypothetical protein FKN15_048181 [Acipenser sinensis]